MPKSSWTSLLITVGALATACTRSEDTASKQAAALDASLVRLNVEVPEDSAAYAEETWEQTCSRLASLTLPENDQPSEDQLAALGPVNSVHHYYGIDTERNYTKARHAAVREEIGASNEGARPSGGGRGSRAAGGALAARP